MDCHAEDGTRWRSERHVTAAKLTPLPFLVFESKTARDAALPNPELGQLVYIRNLGQLYEYNGPGVGATQVSPIDGWTLPWGQAWGSMGYSKVINDTMPAVGSPGVLTDFSQGVSVPVFTWPNRILEVRFEAHCTSNADGDVLEVRVSWFPGAGKHNYTPWSTGTPSMAAYKKVDLTGVAPCIVNMKRRYGTNLVAGTIPTGAGTFIMALGQVTGSAGQMGNTSDAVSFLEVFDIGPAGAPPAAPA